jgi:hypothetical protein
MPDVNVATHVEGDVEAALLRAGSLDALAGRSRFLKRLSSDSESEDDLPDGTADDMAEMQRELATLASTLDELVSAVDNQNPAGAVELLDVDMRPTIGPAAIRRLARRLRAAHHPAALPASASEGAVRNCQGSRGIPSLDHKNSPPGVTAIERRLGARQPLSFRRPWPSGSTVVGG